MPCQVCQPKQIIPLHPLLHSDDPRLIFVSLAKGSLSHCACPLGVVRTHRVNALAPGSPGLQMHLLSRGIVQKLRHVLCETGHSTSLQTPHSKCSNAVHRPKLSRPCFKVLLALKQNAESDGLP